MDFELSEELKQYGKKVREFSLREFSNKVASIYDIQEKYPDELRLKALKEGIIDFSNPWKTMIGIEEMCRVDPGLGISVTVPFFGAEVLMLHGSDHLKEKYLGKVAAGEKIMGLGVTEPGGGSDVAGLKTVARKEGSKYVVNGSKMFITNGTIADFFVMLVRTAHPDDPAKRHRGLSVLVVERNFKGFDSNKLTGKLGVRATNTGELILNEVHVPTENLVGEEGKGFYYIMEFFNISRIFVAAQSVGIAQGALDRTIEYLKNAEKRGEYVGEERKFKLAEMATRVEAARLLMYKAATFLFNYNPNPTLTSMAKGYASETAAFAAEIAMEITGQTGLNTELERFFRDSKIMEIWEGTTEVEKIVISRMMLKGDKNE
ncbi:MAG: acyl-CoA dehydrogenase family protein [Cuniculiplasma sp.]